MRRLKTNEKTLRQRLPLLAGGLVAVLVFLVVGAALFATSSPAFFAKYSHLRPRYESWMTSKHKDVSCAECHQGDQSSVGYRFALVRDFYRSLAGAKSKSPDAVRLQRPTRDACLKCHEEAWSIDSAKLLRVPHPAHDRAADETRDCVKCHKWTAHVERYQEKHKNIPFTGICTSYGCHVGTKSKNECRFCHHSQSFAEAKWRDLHPKVVQASGSSSCLDYCHETKQCRDCHTAGKEPKMGKGSVSAAVGSISRLHSEPKWLDKHGKKAREDRTRCFYCHGSDAECKECHSRRPKFHETKAVWLGRHQEVGKDKSRCLACHTEKECSDCHRIFKEGR